MRILAVEDNPVNLKLLRITLKAMGHAVIEAADGQDALRILETETVDAVISDILMPNMDGYRFCYEIRQSPRLHALPIILYSSTYSTPSDRDLATSFGANAFVEKPASEEKLAAVLRDAVSWPAPPLPKTAEDLGALKRYSERLVTKIEEKNLELAKRASDLEASEEKFRQLADAIHEVFWIANLEGTEILYISPAYASIWGRPCEDLLRNPREWGDAIHEEDRGRVLAALENLRRSGASYDVEFRILRPDGQQRWIRDRGFPVRNSKGTIYRTAGVAEDVTARKTLHEQFVQAQRMEAVGRLAGGVAHDFNNLLTVINGFSQILLQEMESGDPRRTDLVEICKAGERAADLTRQLLAFSRRQVLQPQVININSLVAEMNRMLKRLIGEDVELKTALAPDLGSVRVDAGHFEQVVVNLAVNARDAMPGGGKLTLETSNVHLDESYTRQYKDLKPGPYILLAISDTGQGMSEEVKSHLFEPFYTTKELGKGTGLGLATVHGILKQSEGHIAVYSEPGRGSVFKVYLPRTDAPLDANLRKAGAATLPRGTETILLVEDDEGVRNLTKALLRKAGYFVVEAGGPEEACAISQMRAVRIQLVLTDVVMPGMSGVQMVHLLQGTQPDLKAVFMSGYTDAAILREDILDKGAPFLSKPFTPEALLGKIREVLDG